MAAVVAPADAPSFLSTIRHWPVDARVPEAAGPRAVGALPFTGSGHLVVPAVIVGRDADGRAWRTVIDDVDGPRPAPSARPEPVPSEFVVAAATTRQQWREMVEHALADIARGPLEKVVLARAVRIDADHPFDVPAVLAHLRRSQPGCIVYADRGFLGASPELLLRKAGATVTSRPLAGTAVETAALVRSAKDAHEHRLVVDAVVRALRNFCSDVRADGPSPLELADVSHLATTVTARATPRRPRSPTSSPRCTPPRPSRAPRGGSRSTRSPRRKPSRADATRVRVGGSTAMATENSSSRYAEARSTVRTR